MTAVEVLAAHREDGRLFSLTHEEFSIVRCACGVECGPQRDAHAAHVLDALTKAGMTVTLPQTPNQVIPETEDEWGYEFWTTAVGDVKATPGDGTVSVMIRRDYADDASPAVARSLADALYSAAAAAETGGKA